MIEFKPATKAATKARIALCGPSGSGKTYTALALACTLSEKVAVIDTERGSASKYVGINGWQFDTAAPTSFAPLSLVDALGVAAGNQYGCVVIDSLSHYWMGTDGMLEQADQRRSGSNSFSGWKAVRPDERRMIDALVSYPGHVIVTMRTKTEYVIEEDDRGKKVPRKVGMKPEQRDGIEYEFDVVGDLDHENRLTITKTRIPTLSRAVISAPGFELAQTIREWLEDGVERRSVEEWRDLALASDTTAASLLELYRAAEREQMLGAPTTTEDGQPTVLGDLISGRGRRLREAEEAAKSGTATARDAA